MGCGDEKLSKYLTQTFTAHCNAMICQQVTLSGEAEWPKVADAVIEAVFGTMGAIEQVLSGCGWKISTAFVERLNLDIRQRVAAIGRRVNTLCKGEDGLQHQLALFHVYHNFVLPHASLRQPLPVSEPTHGTGSAKVW